MKSKADGKVDLPRYRGLKWITPPLPTEYSLWVPGERDLIDNEAHETAAVIEELSELFVGRKWKWPRQELYFVSDVHADTDAFFASLVATGGIEKRGPGDGDFRLTGRGRKATFMIGGDFFDKGPSTLRLLGVLKRLIDTGAKVILLAGNHDIRTFLGMRAIDAPPDPRTDHFFVRLGPKVVPLLDEVYRTYLADDPRVLEKMPDEATCRRRLLPAEDWFEEFPRIACWVMPDATIDREMKRLSTKIVKFTDACEKRGLSMRMVYAAARQCRRLFVRPKGEFAWYFRRSRLAHREGSLLFIHAGIDDQIARFIDRFGIKSLNRQYRRQIDGDLFDFYYGPFANSIRTKYRDTDRPLSKRGVALIRKQGILALVHGHKNLVHGQRIMIRKGLLNFECDATLDRVSRAREGLEGVGAAATLFRPNGQVLGISSDYPTIKLFDPPRLIDFLERNSRPEPPGGAGPEPERRP